MKKKLFLMSLMVAALVCIFAVTVSAAEIPEWTEITEVDGMADKSVFGADGTKGATSRVLMSDGKTYPAYYICKNSTSLGFNYEELSTKSGTTYTAVNVVRLEVPMGVISTPQAVLKTANGYTSLLTVSLPEGFTTLGSYTFYGSATAPSALVKVDFPSTLTTMGQKEFLDCAMLEELIIPDGVESIGTDFARNATSLKKLVLPASLKSIAATAFRYAGIEGEVVIPDGCTTIGQYAFGDTKVEKVVLPSSLETLGAYIFYNCDSITEVYSASTKIGEQMFYMCDNVTTVILENTVTIGKQAFNNPNGGTTKISTLVLPEGITSIGEYAFTRCELTEVVTPSTLESMGQNAFQGCKKLTKAVILGSCMGKGMFQDCSNMKVLVLTERITTMANQCIGSVSTSFTTFYTGTDYERVRTLGVATGADRFSTSKTTYCTYEDYVAGNYTAKTCLFVYDANVCDAAFDGVHTQPQDDGDCTTALVCAYCAEHTFREAKVHIESERITYESLTGKGEYYYGCTNEGCNLGTVTETEALFTCLGYSASEIGTGGIVIGYLVNSEAVAEYERVIGLSVELGVFAVSKDKLGSNDIFASDGTVADGVIKVNMTTQMPTAMELKIIGFNDENSGFKLAMGVYFAEAKGEGKEYTYLQIGTPNEGEKYYFASFNDILEMTK